VTEIGDDGNGQEQEGAGWRVDRGLNNMELRIKEQGDRVRRLPLEPRDCRVCREMPLNT